MLEEVQCLAEGLKDVATSYKEKVKPYMRDESKLRFIHSIFMIFWGGSWHWVALLSAIYDVYAVNSFIRRVSSFLFQATLSDTEKCEKKIFMYTHEVFVMLVIIYGVWTVPFLARVTIAIPMQKYATSIAMTPAVITLIEKIIPLRKVFRGWIRMTISTASVFFATLFPAKIQACLLMICLGCDKFFAEAPKSIKDAVAGIKGPKNLDGKTTVLLVLVVISLVWQLLYRFQSSVLGYIVPFGYLILKPTERVRNKRK